LYGVVLRRERHTQRNLVVLDGGKRFFLLSVAPSTITTEEGIRLEEEKD
jgi:hypothetical protein